MSPVSRKRLRPVPLLVLPLLVTACPESPPTEDDPVQVGPAALVVEIDVPSRLAPGEEGEVAVEVRNEGDGATGALELHVVVPGWLEAEPAAGADVTRSDWGVRITYPGPDAGIPAGDSWAIAQAVRRLEEPPADTGRLGSVIRTWITGADGEVLAIGGEVSVPVIAAREGRPPRVTSEGVGPARLGAEVGVLREQMPGTRDTVVHGENAVSVPVQDERSVLGWISEGIIVRVIVDDPVFRMDTGVGVGSSLGRLRKVYGRGCVRGSDGAALAFFPTLPGIEFRLDAAARVEDAVPIQAAAVAEETVVSELWVRRSAEPCPDRIR